MSEARKRAFFLASGIVGVVLLASAVVLVAVPKEAEATFPGQNGKIAYTSYGETDRQVYTINPRGGANTRITNSDSNVQATSYSPDGKRIAYTAFDGYDYEVYTISARGEGSPYQVTHNNENNYYPSYSPDGTRIAYVGYELDDRTDESDPEIYTIDARGEEAPFQVTKNDDTEDGDPSYSPDGKRIAYTVWDGHDYEIYTIDVRGEGVPFRVTDNHRQDVSPTYSPDGERIAFSGTDGHDYEIYTMNTPGGRGKLQLTNNDVPDGQPSYSPDGKRIAYIGAKKRGPGEWPEYDYEIYTIRVGGGGEFQVTDVPYPQAGWIAADPSWGRRP